MSAARWALVLGGAAALSVACKRSPPAADQGPLRVGLVGALTGGEAALGRVLRDGALLAIEQANADGGVAGRRLELVSYDSQGRPEEAASATVRLVTVDGVTFIVGGDTSSSTLAMAPVAARGEVPLVAPAATNPRVTREGGPYVFRVCFVDSFQGGALAAFAKERGMDRVAMLTDLRSDYSMGLADAFRQRFQSLGGTVVGTETYGQGDSDFRAQLTRIKGLRPDALFVPGYYGDAAAIARQARQLGLTIPLLGGDGWDSVAELVSLGGESLEGSEFTTHFSADNPAGAVQGFLKDFQARFGRPPESGAALAYDAARVGIAALRRTGGKGGPALRDALAATAGFPGATGRITLGPERDAVKPAVVLGIRGGRAVFVVEMPP
ncbi:MAG TPA: ABC transporter substrate-binding protein [Myxococcaceae bacterium]|nr:ABC transporter substrate-binding protein [Myxococcaceae bacterium]